MTRSNRTAKALRVLNGTGLVVASGFAAVGTIRPAMARGGTSPESSTEFWAGSSGVRTFAITLPLLASLVRGRPDSGLLVAAGLVQVGDAVLGLRERNAAMALLPALMGAVHLITARTGSATPESPDFVKER